MKFFSFIIILVLAAAFSSCSPSLYFPDRVNAPGFTNQGQAFLTASIKPQIGTNDSMEPKGKGTSFNLDAGYAVSDHIGIIASYRGLNDRGVSEKDWIKLADGIGGIFSGKRYEAAVGYFSGKRNGIMADIYGGIGSGYIDRTGYYAPQYNFRTNYMNYFVQGSIGGNWEFVRLSTGLKIAVYDFIRFDAVTPDIRYTIAETRDGGRRDVTQQAFTFGTYYMDVQMGYRYVMFDFQQGLSAQLSGGPLKACPYYMTLGISLRLDPQFRSNHSTNINTNE